ncbi:ABC transporter ATP-binding protein [Sphingobacterium thalpophilum]|uniref:ABC transporter ATP-binding protein n=1 Tax=Sphingobacterium thalpophilum TaxID=259 RepID=A0ABV4H885_9SPHI
MSILKIEHLSHRYSSAWAIRDINIDVDRKGVIGLLGSNGAGKSTTMNIICGAINPTEGTVRINGYDMRTQSAKAKALIGFLPQFPPLYVDFTVDEYLKYTAELRKMPHTSIRKAVEEAKEKCQLSHFSNRLIKNLSGGYKQRVGIAQAIIHRPQLVILDEPTNGLDPNQLIEARKLIREIGQEHTVLLSSHILNEIQLLCGQIIMIDGGRVVFSDSMEAFHNYVEPDTLAVRFDKPPGFPELQAILGVRKVEGMEGGRIRIQIDKNTDAIDEIVKHSVAQGWKLREIAPEKGALDHAFKEITNIHAR